MFIDGTRITPGSEKCLCGKDCEFPCWQRIGIAPACSECGCPPFEADEPREISVEWDWHRIGDVATPGRYLAQLADALWRHQNAENWATLVAVQVACAAVAGDQDARHDLDTSPAWRLSRTPEPASSEAVPPTEGTETSADGR